MDKYASFVDYELETLSETLAKMETLKNEFSSGSISRIGGRTHYTHIMQTASAIIKTLSTHPGIIPENYKTTVKHAIMYTQSVQSDLLYEICKSPIAAWHIRGITSHIPKIDDRLFSYNNHLEYVQSNTDKIKKIQDPTKYIDYPIADVDQKINQNIPYIREAARIWSDVMTMVDAQRGDSSFVDPMLTITTDVLVPFVSCVNRHIQNISTIVEKKIHYSSNNTDHNRQLFQCYKTILELTECMDRDISYLTKKSDNVDMIKQMNIFYTSRKHYNRLYNSYRTLSQPFKPTTTYANHPGSQASGSI